MNATHFIFFCGGVFYFFLESDPMFVGMSPSWSAGLCRDKAKLSAVLRSSEKSGQYVMGRWFRCLVDGSCVVF